MLPTMVQERLSIKHHIGGVYNLFQWKHHIAFQTTTNNRKHSLRLKQIYYDKMIGDIKHIYVIQSLLEGDSRSGEELYEDTIRRRIDYFQPDNRKMRHLFFNANTKAALTDYLKYIAQNSYLMKNGVLIHFEMHGSGNRNGLICSDHSLITWRELVNAFREINIGSNNGLYISLASCFGRDLWQGTDPELKSPYSGFISASKDVRVEEILQNFSSMFEILIEKGNLITAYLEASNDETSFYYKDSKETFNLTFEDVKNRLLNDPNFKREVLGAKFYELFPKTSAEDEAIVDSMMRSVLNEIYQRQLKTFMF